MKGRMEQLCIRKDAIGLLQQQETTVLKEGNVLECRTKNCFLHILGKIYRRSNKSDEEEERKITILRRRGSSSRRRRRIGVHCLTFFCKIV
jgi:hypothetical protein